MRKLSASMTYRIRADIGVTRSDPSNMVPTPAAAPPLPAADPLPLVPSLRRWNPFASTIRPTPSSPSSLPNPTGRIAVTVPSQPHLGGYISRELLATGIYQTTTDPSQAVAVYIIPGPRSMPRQLELVVSGNQHLLYSLRSTPLCPRPLRSETNWLTPG